MAGAGHFRAPGRSQLLFELILWGFLSNNVHNPRQPHQLHFYGRIFLSSWGLQHQSFPHELSVWSGHFRAPGPAHGVLSNNVHQPRQPHQLQTHPYRHPRLFDIHPSHAQLSMWPGRGEANGMLGMLQLHELMMTAAQSIVTPIMTVPLLATCNKHNCQCPHQPAAPPEACRG
ncbi:hypothetical protein COCOBI_03-0190 [Coccomyxa sp. Obi]|nr:hypothetical protein COCOBI_03-0190 [Coccomyxa sp. Obi]